MCQGQRSIIYYAVDFWILASRSSWASTSLTEVFLHGMADCIKDLLIAYEIPTSLDGMKDLAI